MSESSVPRFGVRWKLRSARETIKRILSGRRSYEGSEASTVTLAPDPGRFPTAATAVPSEPELLRPAQPAPAPSGPGEERAVALIEEHLREHSTTLERAGRLADRAERLDRENTPSETARIRAARAIEEVSEELRYLRDRFTREGGAVESFDRAVKSFLEDLRLPDAGATKKDRPEAL